MKCFVTRDIMLRKNVRYFKKTSHYSYSVLKAGDLISLMYVSLGNLNFDEKNFYI